MEADKSQNLARAEAQRVRVAQAAQAAGMQSVQAVTRRPDVLSIAAADSGSTDDSTPQVEPLLGVNNWAKDTAQKAGQDVKDLKNTIVGKFQQSKNANVSLPTTPSLTPTPTLLPNISGVSSAVEGVATSTGNSKLLHGGLHTSAVTSTNTSAGEF